MLKFSFSKCKTIAYSFLETFNTKTLRDIVMNWFDPKHVLVLRCPMCNYAKRNIGIVLSHYAKYHDEPATLSVYICSVCDLVSSSEQLLEDHIGCEHEDLLEGQASVKTVIHLGLKTIVHNNERVACSQNNPVCESKAAIITGASSVIRPCVDASTNTTADSPTTQSNSSTQTTPASFPTQFECATPESPNSRPTSLPTKTEPTVDSSEFTKEGLEIRKVILPKEPRRNSGQKSMPFPAKDATATAVDVQIESMDVAASTSRPSSTSSSFTGTVLNNSPTSATCDRPFVQEDSIMNCAHSRAPGHQLTRPPQTTMSSSRIPPTAGLSTDVSQLQISPYSSGASPPVTSLNVSPGHNPQSALSASPDRPTVMPTFTLSNCSIPTTAVTGSVQVLSSSNAEEEAFSRYHKAVAYYAQQIFGIGELTRTDIESIIRNYYEIRKSTSDKKEALFLAIKKSFTKNNTETLSDCTPLNGSGPTFSKRPGASLNTHANFSRNVLPSQPSSNTSLAAAIPVNSDYNHQQQQVLLSRTANNYSANVTTASTTYPAPPQYTGYNRETAMNLINQHSVPQVPPHSEFTQHVFMRPGGAHTQNNSTRNDFSLQTPSNSSLPSSITVNSDYNQQLHQVLTSPTTNNYSANVTTASTTYPAPPQYTGYNRETAMNLINQHSVPQVPPHPNFPHAHMRPGGAHTHNNSTRNDLPSQTPSNSSLPSAIPVNSDYNQQQHRVLTLPTTNNYSANVTTASTTYPAPPQYTGYNRETAMNLINQHSVPQVPPHPDFPHALMTNNIQQYYARNNAHSSPQFTDSQNVSLSGFGNTSHQYQQTPQSINNNYNGSNYRNQTVPQNPLYPYMYNQPANQATPVNNAQYAQYLASHNNHYQAVTNNTQLQSPMMTNNCQMPAYTNSNNYSNNLNANSNVFNDLNSQENRCSGVASNHPRSSITSGSIIDTPSHHRSHQSSENLTMPINHQHELNTTHKTSNSMLPNTNNVTVSHAVVRGNQKELSTPITASSVACLQNSSKAVTKNSNKVKQKENTSKRAKDLSKGIEHNTGSVNISQNGSTEMYRNAGHNNSETNSLPTVQHQGHACNPSNNKTAISENSNRLRESSSANKIQSTGTIPQFQNSFNTAPEKYHGRNANSTEHMSQRNTMNLANCPASKPGHVENADLSTVSINRSAMNAVMPAPIANEVQSNITGNSVSPTQNHHGGITLGSLMAMSLAHTTNTVVSCTTSEPVFSSVNANLTTVSKSGITCSAHRHSPNFQEGQSHSSGVKRNCVITSQNNEASSNTTESIPVISNNQSVNSMSILRSEKAYSCPNENISAFLISLNKPDNPKEKLNSVQFPSQSSGATNNAGFKSQDDLMHVKSTLNNLSIVTKAQAKNGNKCSTAEPPHLSANYVMDSPSGNNLNTLRHMPVSTDLGEKSESNSITKEIHSVRNINEPSIALKPILQKESLAPLDNTNIVNGSTPKKASKVQTQCSVSSMPVLTPAVPFIESGITMRQMLETDTYIMTHPSDDRSTNSHKQKTMKCPRLSPSKSVSNEIMSPKTDRRLNQCQLESPEKEIFHFENEPTQDASLIDCDLDAEDDLLEEMSMGSNQRAPNVPISDNINLNSCSGGPISYFSKESDKHEVHVYSHHVHDVCIENNNVSVKDFSDTNEFSEEFDLTKSNEITPIVPIKNTSDAAILDVNALQVVQKEKCSLSSTKIQKQTNTSEGSPSKQTAILAHKICDRLELHNVRSVKRSNEESMDFIDSSEEQTPIDLDNLQVISELEIAKCEEIYETNFTVSRGKSSKKKSHKKKAKTSTECPKDVFSFINQLNKNLPKDISNYKIPLLKRKHPKDGTNTDEPETKHSKKHKHKNKIKQPQESNETASIEKSNKTIKSTYFRCTFCSRCFKSKWELSDHVQQCHKCRHVDRNTLLKQAQLDIQPSVQNSPEKGLLSDLSNQAPLEKVTNNSNSKTILALNQCGVCRAVLPDLNAFNQHKRIAHGVPETTKWVGKTGPRDGRELFSQQCCLSATSDASNKKGEALKEKNNARPKDLEEVAPSGESLCSESKQTSSMKKSNFFKSKFSFQRKITPTFRKGNHSKNCKDRMY